MKRPVPADDAYTLAWGYFYVLCLLIGILGAAIMSWMPGLWIVGPALSGLLIWTLYKWITREIETHE